MKSVMKHQFSQIPKIDLPRSRFNRSHGHKSTFDAGYLIPVFVDEALPGDTFNLNLTAFGRLATPIFPIMDNLYMDTFFFSVPVRLIWDNFTKFMGEQIDPGDSIDYTVPQVTVPAGGHDNSSLFDYMGIPPKKDTFSHSALFSRAYNLIWNEWFRDENLQDSITVDKGDGPDTASNYVLKRRGKRHDYFTSCLPWPQKGNSVDLPLGTDAPITGIGKYDQTYDTGPFAVYETDGSGTTSYTKYKVVGDATSPLYFGVEEDPNNTGYPNIRADLTNATAATINELRQAFQIQRLLERDARAGTRYVEIIKSHFGVTTPSQGWRSEYLGGGSQPVIVNPIAQTSSTDATSPQGNLSAMATVVINNHGFTKSFTEHCVIIGLVSCRADLTYQQGLERMFSRSTRYDFYFPVLSHLGEQSVLNKEIWLSENATIDDAVFGYQERYAEYRYKNSKITGELRSDHATSLDSWHLSQDFATLPTLNSTFIEDNPPIDRIIAVAGPHFIWDSFFSLNCARPMPIYSVPGLIDHF